MPLQTQATLAALPVADKAMYDMATSLRKAYGSTAKAYEFMTHDPLLQKQPSLALSIHQYLSGAIGPWPIQDQNVVDIQKNLARLGFGSATGAKLPTDGVWSTGWNQAYNAYVESRKTAALGGGQAGSTPVSSALSWFSDIMPREAVKGVVGYISQLPHHVVDDFRYIGGQFAASTHVLLENPFGNFNRPAENRAAASAENVVNRAFGQRANVTAKTAVSAQPLSDQMYQSALVLGDLLAAHGLFRAGSTVAQAAGEAGFRSLSLDEATRGPGAVMRSIYDNSGEVPRGLYTNTPILKYTGPVVGKIIGGGTRDAEGKLVRSELGLYYKARSLLATPYAYGPVRVAGTAVGQLGVAGAKVRAIGNIESKINPAGTPSSLQQAIDRYQAIDYYDHMLRRYTYNASGGHMAVGLDSLAWILHPPLSGTGQVSAGIGQDITNTNNLFGNALGNPTSLAAHIERGVNMSQRGQKYLTHAQIMSRFDTPEHFDEFWINQIARYAAAHDAELRMSKMSGQDIQDRLDSLGVMAGHDDVLNMVAGEARGDPNRIAQALAEMLAADNPLKNKFGGPNELTKRIAADIHNTDWHASEWSNGNRDHWLDQGVAHSRVARDMREHIVPREAEFIHDDQIGREPSAQARSVLGQIGPASRVEHPPEPPGGFAPNPTNEPPKGRLGLAPLDYYGRHEATQEATDARQEYEAALGPRKRNPETGRTMRDTDFERFKDAQHYLPTLLYDRYGIDHRQLGKEDDQLFSLLDGKASRQAAEVFPSEHTSQEAQDALDRIHEQGFKVVSGNNIGHDFYEHPFMDVRSGALTAARRTVERLGLSSENVPTVDHAFVFGLNLHRELINSMENNKIELMPYDTANAIIAKLRDDGVIPDSGLASTLYTNRLLHGRKYEADVKKLSIELNKHGVENPEATARARLTQALDAPLGIYNIREQDVIKSLGRGVGEEAKELKDRPVLQTLGNEGKLVNLKPGERLPWYDERQAREVFRDIQKAKVAMPMRLTGLQHIEDLMNVPLGWAGRHLPGATGKALEALPSNLVRLRAQARWTLSPEFSLRRVVKTGLKTSLDGVPFTFTPRASMEKAGTYEQAMADRARIFPHLVHKLYQEGVDSLYTGDIWFFNHEDWEAYAIHDWVNRGFSDKQIQEMFVKDFGYGSKAYGEGRSSLEKSANWIFFPLSFDKTLYRNVGAHLLDHPAQRMMLTAGLAAYNRFNVDHPNGDAIGSSSWFQKHVPLAQEALRLNAFAHGIGLGEFGGINAPLLNLFIPQQYNVDPRGLQTLKGLIPMIRELQDVVTEGRDTFYIGRQEIRNKWQDEFGHQAGTNKIDQEIFSPQVVAETQSAQLTDAYAYRDKLKSMLQTEIAWNAHHKDKYKLGNSPDFGVWKGRTINSTLVDELTNAKYPAFNIAEPSIYYDKANAAITEYSNQMQAQNPLVVSWIQDAQKYGTDIYNGKITGAGAATDTAIFRRYAIKFAETIPGFLAFYNANFKWQYGPLEAVRTP